jgi:hypothetical protein
VRATDAPVYVDPQPGWAYAYAKPNECLKVLAVVPAFSADYWWLGQPSPFILETDELTGAELILTDLADAVIIYQRKIVDTTVFPAQFVSALSWLLASYLAGPVVKGQAGRKAAVDCMGVYTREIATAAVLNANQSVKRPSFVPAQHAGARLWGVVPDTRCAGVW